MLDYTILLLYQLTFYKYSFISLLMS